MAGRSEVSRPSETFGTHSMILVMEGLTTRLLMLAMSPEKC